MEYFTTTSSSNYWYGPNGSSGEGNIFTNTKSNASLNCSNRPTASFLAISIVPGLAVLMNLFVLAAVLRKSRKLMRESHIYAHVSSTLIGNVFFSVLALLQVI